MNSWTKALAERRAVIEAERRRCLEIIDSMMGCYGHDGFKALRDAWEEIAGRKHVG